MSQDLRMSRMKKREVQYGRTICRIKVGPNKVTFTVHEDLLCANSAFFKAKFQANRRPLEEVCAICQEDLQPWVMELMYCKECGNNAHHACMSEWIDGKTRKGEQVTCPLCRRALSEPDLQSEIVCPRLEETPFEIYVEWLYNRCISLGTNARNPDEEVTDERDAEDNRRRRATSRHADLLTAYFLGVTLQDPKFRQAILKAILELVRDSLYFPGNDVIIYAYGETSHPSAIRRFLVSLYANGGEGDWIADEEDDDLPFEFVRDLAAELYARRAGGWSLDGIAERLERDEACAELGA